MFKGTVDRDCWGNLTFEFEDGTWAVAEWCPFGEHGDGQGGEFNEENIKIGENAKITVEQLLELAYKNFGAMNSPITN